ncbi:fasciclin domain-containing protein [Algibacter sp. AS12]|uniref:fasciclin domain-containing protein n=1 Tax=Algibacter sp. AS12 TaxID=3135773 RepID=UPI00398B448D
MMHRKSLIILCVIMAAFGCKPDPLEYARPDNLAGTIYTQLESLGTFNYYLQALDQSAYKEPLSKGGSWTIFAPEDDAFEQFMSDEGYANFEAIPAERLDDILKFSIVIDGWNTTTLTYFKNRFYEGQSFRRRTQYQEPYTEIDSDTLQHILDYNTTDYSGIYKIDPSLGRLKTVVYFLDSFIDNYGFETTDYDFMFPGETYNPGDMKVFDAHVTQQNVVAENGIIYALNKVLEPHKNLYENLSSPEYNDKYSTFKKLLERFSTIRSIGDVLNEETGETEEIFQLRFATGLENDYLPFNPADENYATNIDGTLAYAWGLLAPTNDALDAYLDGDSVLGRFYDSFDDMPLDVVGKFLSPYFFNNFYDICPSSFGQSYDTSIKLVDYKAGDVVDKKFCGNGFFVGVNTVYTNNSFGTIMGPLLLDPEYAVMLRAIQNLGIDTALESKAVRFSILGIKNDQFVNVADPNSATRMITIVPEVSENGFLSITMEVTGDPDDANNRTYANEDSSTYSADFAYMWTTIQDIVLNNIVDEDVDFAANNFYQARSGEYVYTFDGNSAAGGGDILLNRSSQVVSTTETDNGNFYEMSDIIERPLEFTYGALANEDNVTSFSSFIEVLETADALITIIGSDDKLINFLNLQKTFTLFAPNNAAVAQAIADGVIVEPSTVSGLDDLNQAIAKRDLLDFAKKHFLQQSLTTDGKSTGTFPSMYFGQVIDFAPVYDQFSVVNTTSSITLTNEASGESVTTNGSTNILSKRVVIHEINNYIK